MLLRNNEIQSNEKTTLATVDYKGIICPIGSIVAYGANIDLFANAPAGWLKCDGSQISRTTYAALFAAIGIQWGEGDATTTFHLPDLRGLFLRGRDEAQGRDYYAGSRSAINVGGNTGDNVGGYITHTTGLPTQVGFSGYTSSFGNRVTNTQYNSTGHSATMAEAQNSFAHSHSVVIDGGGDGETQPENVVVQYLIKAY